MVNIIPDLSVFNMKHAAHPIGVNVCEVCLFDFYLIKLYTDKFCGQTVLNGAFGA